LIGRGEMRLELGAADLALADFQQAVEKQRDNARALFGLGKAYALLGGGDRAVRPLTRYLESPDKDEEKLAEAYRLRGQSYAALGKMPEAMQDIQESLKINPDDYQTYAVLAAIMYRQQDFVNALRAITVSIEKYVPDPENPQPYVQGYLTKTSILIDLGDLVPSEETKYQVYEAAVHESDLLLQQLGEAPQYAAIRSAALFGRGVALRLQGNLDDAIDSLSQAIQLNPESAEAYFRRGICYFSIGEERLALADFKQAGIIGIDDPRARLWEGMTYTKKGDLYDAVRAYGQAIAESDRYVPAYVNRGLTYIQLGQFDKAIDDFNEAIRMEPTAAPHYFKRGLAYAELGDPEKAADSFASAIELNNKYVPAYQHMARAMAALGYSELAEQYRAKAEELEAAAKSAG
jgi:tetratricopeptide (TPR) repeat protein